MKSWRYEFYDELTEHRVEDESQRYDDLWQAYLDIVAERDELERQVAALVAER